MRGSIVIIQQKKNNWLTDFIRYVYQYKLTLSNSSSAFVIVIINGADAFWIFVMFQTVITWCKAYLMHARAA